MKIIPNKLPKRVRVFIQEVESGKTKKGKPGTQTIHSKTYQFTEIDYNEFVKRFEQWINTQAK